MAKTDKATSGSSSSSGNGVKITLDWDSSKLRKNIKVSQSKIQAVTLMYASTEAEILQAYMKTNRPWTDRTGLAKSSLSTSVSTEGETAVIITLGFGLNGINCPYGIWLEFAHNRNYAIVQPTIETQGPKVLKQFTGMMQRIFG